MDIMQAIPSGSKVFAKLDALHGYHQLELDEESRKLTTFLLPSGRYRYKRGPMGLRSTGDVWCFRSDVVVNDIEGCFKIVDDILVAARNMKELRQKLEEILKRCVQAGLVIHRRKIKIATSISFAGFHVCSRSGCRSC